MFRGCVRVASRVNGVPPAVLLMLLQVEGGRLGEVSGIVSRRRASVMLYER